jgi:hypothetical protein
LSKIERLGTLDKTSETQPFKGLKMHSLKFWFLGLALALLSFESMANMGVDRRGRLGIGLSNQLQTDAPSFSFKLQQSRSFSLGGLASVNTASDGGFGGGLKLHRHFFEEPHLVFYGALLAAYINDKRGSGVESQSGFQADLTLGTEFHFQGLQSVGFHIDFGLTFSKLDDFTIRTVGSQFLVMGMHFYL